MMRFLAPKRGVRRVVGDVLTSEDLRVLNADRRKLPQDVARRLSCMTQIFKRLGVNARTVHLARAAADRIYPLPEMVVHTSKTVH